ncbi:MAG TPA: cupin-like domain-containing protein [Myxococcales bacterium]|nr:cupin-like domain-containing protein [Myxococcales bacterium]
MKIGELERIADPDLGAFEAYARRGMPVIIDGMARDWPALSWTVEHIERQCGGNDVYYEQYPDDRSRLGWWNFGHGKLSEYLQRMRRDEEVYITNADVGEYFPQLMGDLRLPPFISADRKLKLPKYRMFIGRAQRTEIHYHPGLQVILVHLHGAKRKIRLYPPSETPRLYPFRWYEQVQMSRVLPDREAEFPLFKEARYYECDLDPGQGLFIPIHWWHWAQSFSETIAVGLVFLRKLGDKFDLRLELRDRASEAGESMLKLSPKLAAAWKRFAERSAFGA